MKEGERDGGTERVGSKTKKNRNKGQSESEGERGERYAAEAEEETKRQDGGVRVRDVQND